MTPSAAACPRCFAPILPSESPGGLCPKCMIAVAMGEDGMIRSAYGSPVPAPPGIDELSPHFPGLEIFALVGRGGSGAVYRAIQRDLGRVIALKVLLLDPANDPAFGERFAREARAMARLNHPNIASVHDAGKAGPYWFLTMEFVDGANLRQVLRQGSMNAADALDFTRQICAALEYAHGMGVVHRDIKPENVLVDESGVVKLVDFGLAKLVGGAPEAVSLTGASQAMGTWRYMAPEQLSRPREVDHRADIFSLGVVLYELLTGEVPQGRYAPLSSRANVDRRLDDVVDRTLEQDPDRRYQEVRGVGEDLDSIGRGGAEPLHAVPKAPPEEQAPAQRASLTYRQQRKLQKAELSAQRGCFGQLFHVLPWIILGFLIITALPLIFFRATSVQPQPSGGRKPVGAPGALEIEEPRIVAQMVHRMGMPVKASPLLEGRVHRLAMEYLIAEEGAVNMTRMEGPDRSWLQIDISAFEATVTRLEDELLSAVEGEFGANERAAVEGRFEAQSPFRFGRSACSFEYVRKPTASLNELGGRQALTGDEIKERLPLHVRRQLVSRLHPVLKVTDVWVLKGSPGVLRTAEWMASVETCTALLWQQVRRSSSRVEFDARDWSGAYVWNPAGPSRQELMTGLRKGVEAYGPVISRMMRGLVTLDAVQDPFTLFVHDDGRCMMVPQATVEGAPDPLLRKELDPMHEEWLRRAFSQ